MVSWWFPENSMCTAVVWCVMVPKRWPSRADEWYLLKSQLLSQPLIHDVGIDPIVYECCQTVRTTEEEKLYME